MASVHHVRLNDYVADSFREEVVASLVLFRDTHASLTTVIASMEGSKKEIRDQGESIAATITKLVDDICAINNHEQVLLQQAWKVMGREVDVQNRQQEDLQLALATLNNLVSYIQRMVMNASDEEFVSMKQRMTSHVFLKVYLQ